jgi:hypothetical protein
MPAQPPREAGRRGPLRSLARRLLHGEPGEGGALRRPEYRFEIDDAWVSRSVEPAAYVTAFSFRKAQTWRNP